MNQFFTVLKLQFNDDHIAVIDGVIANIIEQNLIKVKDDYFSLLHMLISMFKETSESGKKRFKKTTTVVLSSLADLEISKFKAISTDRAVKDELERIVQFLGIAATDFSFN